MLRQLLQERHSRARPERMLWPDDRLATLMQVGQTRQLRRCLVGGMPVGGEEKWAVVGVGFRAV